MCHDGRLRASGDQVGVKDVSGAGWMLLSASGSHTVCSSVFGSIQLWQFFFSHTDSHEFHDLFKLIYIFSLSEFAEGH